MAIGLYLHVPFCIRKCNYCSFVSAPREDELVAAYLKALGREIEIYSRSLAPENKAVDSIYIGGGTPTCLSGGELAEILERIFSYFNVPGTAEITVEANPGTVDPEKLKTLNKLGVNRLSMGIQACQPELLGLLGRIHSWDTAADSFGQARRAGFDNINVDLIFGIPGQDPGQWHRCLEKVAGLNPDHISAYGLQVEEGTPLYERVKSGELDPCNEDLEADMFGDLIDTLAGLGYVHYEISNFARPGSFCRHNLRYWQNLSYLGLGPAAHSYLEGWRFANHDGLERYAGELAADSLPVCRRERIDQVTEMSETVFLGLRLVEGLAERTFRERFGKAVDNVYPDQIARLTGLGLLERSGGRLRLTRRGLMLGNVVFSEFV